MILAVKWLGHGGLIQQVAVDLGYESVPSLVTIFAKALSTSPQRHMAKCHPKLSRSRDEAQSACAET